MNVYSELWYKYTINTNEKLQGENVAIQYRLNVNTQNSFNWQPGAASTYMSQGNYRIISQGSSDNLIDQYTLKVTVNANGEVTHQEFDFGTPKCVG